LATGVAVEKVVFFKNRLKLGDRKCLPDPRRSFIAHPDGFDFCEFREKEFFNSHRRLHQLRIAGENSNFSLTMRGSVIAGAEE
jgi:hypothetical protein